MSYKTCMHARTVSWLSHCKARFKNTDGCRGEEVVKQWIADNLDGGKVVKESLAGSSSWSSAYVYHTESGKKFFVKLSLGRDSSMFEGEALGLQALYGNHLLNMTSATTCTPFQSLARMTIHCRYQIDADTQDPPLWFTFICSRR